jgi:hypothetical protein
MQCRPVCGGKLVRRPKLQTCKQDTCERHRYNSPHQDTVGAVLLEEIQFSNRGIIKQLVRMNHRIAMISGLPVNLRAWPILLAKEF